MVMVASSRKSANLSKSLLDLSDKPGDLGGYYKLKVYDSIAFKNCNSFLSQRIAVIVVFKVHSSVIASKEQV